MFYDLIVLYYCNLRYQKAAMIKLTEFFIMFIQFIQFCLILKRSLFRVRSLRHIPSFWNFSIDFVES